VAGYQNLDVGNVNSYDVTIPASIYPYYYRLRAYNEIGTSSDSNVISALTTQVQLVFITTKVGVFSFDIDGSGSVLINWGDGSDVQTVSFTGLGVITITHTYTEGGQIRIYSIDNITYLNMAGMYISSAIIPAECTAIENIYLNQNNLTEFEAHEEWINLEQLNLQVNNLTEISTFASWANLTVLALGDNSIASIDTFASWVNLLSFSVDINNITTLETHPEWSSIDAFSASENDLTSLVLHPEWTEIRSINIHDNMSLISITTSNTWTKLTMFELTNCPIGVINTYDTWIVFFRLNVYNAGLATLEAFREWGGTFIQINARENDIISDTDINNILIEIITRPR
jgi:hypothetical protein